MSKRNPYAPKRPRPTKYYPGYRQGMLTIQTPPQPDEKGLYKCIVYCDCGNITEIFTNYLSLGKVNCGCQASNIIYFIRGYIDDDHDYMKIGRTDNDPRTRLAVVQTHFPYPVKLVRTLDGDRSVEKALHEYFKDQHLMLEWFRTVEEMFTITLEILREKYFLGEFITIAERPEDLGF